MSGDIDQPIISHRTLAVRKRKLYGAFRQYLKKEASLYIREGYHLYSHFRKEIAIVYRVMCRQVISCARVTVK